MNTTDTQAQIRMAIPSLDEQEVEAVTAVMRSGQLSEGPKTREFEQAFAAAEGAAWGVATSSGSTALLCAYLAAVPAGQEVLVPGFGFFATAAMVVAAGAVPVFCDVDTETFNILPEEVELRAGDRTRAAAPVHMFGNPVDVEPLELACREKGLRIIWDAAQSHGATYRDKSLGAFPDLACYSFYPTKNMTTGEGGIVLGHDAGLETKIRRLKNHGQEGRYNHRFMGYNFRSTDIASAIGLVQLTKLPAWNEARRRNAARLTAALSELSGLRVPVATEGAVHVYHQYTLVLDLHRLTISRDEFAAKLAEKGVQSGVHYPLPLYLQPALSSHAPGAVLPNAIELSRSVLSIPVHPGLSEADVDRVAEAVRDVHDASLK